MEDLSEKVLHVINEKDVVDTLDLCSSLDEDHQKIVGVIKSLQSLEVRTSQSHR